MIEIIKDVPETVCGFRAVGQISKEDYDNVVIPTIDQFVEKQGKINFLLVLHTSLSDFTIGAIVDDLSVGLKYFTKWHKMAIVSDSVGINTFTNLFSFVSPGEAKGFTHAELDEAKRWVST
jgi:hypothetical protein